MIFSRRKPLAAFLQFNEGDLDNSQSSFTVTQDDPCCSAKSDVSSHPLLLQAVKAAQNDINQQEERQEDNTPPVKLVRFNEMANEYHRDPLRVAADCPETWYNDQDYANFDYDMLQCVAEATATTSDEEQNSFVVTVSRMYKVLLKFGYLTAQEQDELVQAVAQNMDLIGLEHMLVAAIRKDMRGRSGFLQDVVYEAQHNDHDDDDSVMDDEEEADFAAEELRASCCSISRTSCLLAHHLALAL